MKNLSNKQRQVVYAVLKELVNDMQRFKCNSEKAYMTSDNFIFVISANDFEALKQAMDIIKP